MEWKEKISSQLLHFTKKMFQIFHIPVRLKRILTGWIRKFKHRRKIFKKQLNLWEKITRETSKQYDDDDKDSNKSYFRFKDPWGEDETYGNYRESTGKRRVPEPAVSEDGIRLFLDALQYNVVFEKGFKVQGSSNNDK